MKANLTSPEVVTEYTKAYHDEWDRLQKTNRTEANSVERSLNRVMVQIDRVVNAISDSNEPVGPLTERLKQLERERVSLAERLRLIKSQTSVVSLHPTAIKKFASSVEALHLFLNDRSEINSERGARVQAAFRNLIERIVVHPTGKRMPYEVTPYARLSAITNIDLFPQDAQR